MDTPKVYKNLINGEWVESQSGRVLENRNPAAFRLHPLAVDKVLIDLGGIHRAAPGSPE